MLGATHAEVAELLGLPKSTVDTWSKSHAEYRAAFSAGREGADARVAAALFKRAVGYKRRGVKYFHYQGLVTDHEVIEYYPPDVGAATTWLSRRRPDIWGGKDERGAGGADGVHLTLDAETAALAGVVEGDITPDEDDVHEERSDLPPELAEYE